MNQDWCIEPGYVGDKQVPFLTRPGRDGIRLDEESAEYIAQLMRIGNGPISQAIRVLAAEVDELRRRLPEKKPRKKKAVVN